MHKQKPVNLNLMTIKFPITAIVSILHRISGVVLFLFIPFLVWILAGIMGTTEQFAQVQRCLSGPVATVFVWGLLAALLYHLVAGVRHLLMDMGYGESKQGGRIGAWLMLTVAVILIVLLGISLW